MRSALIVILGMMSTCSSPKVVENTDEHALSCEWDPTSDVSRVVGHLAARMPKLGPQARFLLAQTIVRESQDAQLDPLLVLAMIHAESFYDPRAKSSTGARGLMQLLPSTMAREGSKICLRGDEITDPMANVTVGIRYLSKLRENFRGSIRLAIMAYNVGPSQLGRALRDGQVPVEAIDYYHRIHEVYRRITRQHVSIPQKI